MFGFIQMMRPPREDEDRATPSTLEDHTDSVAPPVKMHLARFYRSNAPSLSRALSIAARRGQRRGHWMDRRNSDRRYGSIASRAVFYQRCGGVEINKDHHYLSLVVLMLGKICLGETSRRLIGHQRLRHAISENSSRAVAGSCFRFGTTLNLSS